jgi:hypothetical protein
MWDKGNSLNWETSGAGKKRMGASWVALLCAFSAGKNLQGNNLVHLQTAPWQ